MRISLILTRPLFLRGALIFLCLSPLPSAEAGVPAGASMEKLAEACAADPGNAELLYRTGRAFAAAGDYARALGYFERALRLDPTLAAEAHLRMGRSYRAMGFGSLAAEEFTAVTRIAPGSDAASAAERYLGAKVPRFRLPRIVYGNAEAGYAYDSNVTLQPNDAEIVGLSGKGDFRFFTSASTLLELLRTERWSLGPSYSFYQSVHNHLGLYNLQEHTAGATLWGRLSVFQPQVAYRYRYSFLDDNTLDFYRTHEVSASLIANEGARFFSRIYYVYRHDDYMIDVIDSADDQGGHNNGVGAEQFFLPFGGRGYVQGGVAFDRNSALGDNYLYNGLKVYGAGAVPLPMHWLIEAQAEYYFRDYPDNAEARRDHRQIYSAALVKVLNRHVSIRGEYILTVNSSRDSFFSYDRSIFALSTLLSI